MSHGMENASVFFIYVVEKNMIITFTSNKVVQKEQVTVAFRS